MSTPFAINGLGRMGRAALRIALEQSGLELVAVNDVAPADQLAGLVARDSLHGTCGHDVSTHNGDLTIDGRRIRVFNEPDTASIPWQETAARIVPWYDNEWGHATRLIDVLCLVGGRLT